MADNDFLAKIPFSNLAGARLKNLATLYRQHKVERPFWFHALLNLLVSLILSLPAFFERWMWKIIFRKQQKSAPPLFILGHWRSGTTHLHNFFCLDERAGFITTYQTVFPNNLLFINKPLRWVMQVLMPKTRPVDGMPLNPDLPQEEEFGLGNVFELCYYHWWYFPKDWDAILTHYLTLENLSEEDCTRWQHTYSSFINKALYLQDKTWLVSKNPPNTARIKSLLEIYPDARFVFIQRNPYAVFESTRSFFKAILAPLKLQNITDDELDTQILKSWCALHDAYQQQKLRIPKNRLVELHYEKFVQNEPGYMRFIYTQLEISIPTALPEKWENARTMNPHAPRTYNQKTIGLVNTYLGHRIEEMGYQKEVSGLPDHT